MSDTFLWSDERIITEVDDYLWEATAEDRERARRLLRRTRDNFEQARQQDAALLAAKDAEIARLTEWLNVSNNLANEFEAQLNELEAWVARGASDGEAMDATPPATQGQAIPSAEMLTVLKFAVNYLHWNGLHKGATEDWVAAINWLNEQDAPTPPAVPVDVDYTIRVALEVMRRRTVDVEAVDAAMAWLKKQKVAALPAVPVDDLMAAAIPALEWIDEIYPPDIFDGSSGDEGPVRIVAIRENLRRALQPRPGKETQP